MFTKDGRHFEVHVSDDSHEYDSYLAIIRAKGNMDAASLETLSTDPNYRFLVAKTDDVIGGLGLVRVVLDAPTYPRVYVDSFVVREDMRNQGVGHGLIQTAYDLIDEGDALTAIVATYVGIQKKKFVRLGFDILLKEDALEKGILYKDDWYASLSKNHGCSLFLMPK